MAVTWMLQVSQMLSALTLTDSISDLQSSRTLDFHAYNSDSNTGPACQTQCQQLGYLYAGTEYGGECYCSNSVNSIAKSEPDTDCNMACPADPSQPCGGPDRINLFWNGTTSSVTPTAPDKSLPSGWNPAGCFTDAVGSRALSNWIVGPGTGMTVEFCVRGCASQGYTYAGLEFGDECYCGTSIDNNQTSAAPADCNMPCSGDSTEICGARDRLSLYTTKVISSSSVVSQSASATQSSSTASSSVSSSTSSTSSTSTVSSTSTTSSATTNTASSSAPASSTSVSAAKFPADTPAGTVYAGCYSGAYLDYQYNNEYVNSPGLCVAECGRETPYYPYAAAFGSYCFCGTIASFKQLTKLDESQCQWACPGNNQFICGGYGISVYTTPKR